MKANKGGFGKGYGNKQNEDNNMAGQPKEVQDNRAQKNRNIAQNQKVKNARKKQGE